MNLLLASGHPDARFYPLGLLKDEAGIIEARWSREEAARATLLQLAISSAISEKAAKEFNKLVSRMSAD